MKKPQIFLLVYFAIVFLACLFVKLNYSHIGFWNGFSTSGLILAPVIAYIKIKKVYKSDRS